MTRHIITACASTTLLFTASTASAVMIGFEAIEGYAAGNMNAQPTGNSRWTATTGVNSLGEVVTTGGNPGQVFRLSGLSSNFGNAVYTPTPADLGVGTDAATGVWDYSVDLKYETSDALTTTAANNSAFTLNFFRDTVGTTINGLPLIVQLDGDLRFSFKNPVNQSTRTIDRNLFGTRPTATTSVAGAFVSTGFRRISGQVDFGNSTFTIFVDGVQITDNVGTTLAPNIVSTFAMAGATAQDQVGSFQFVKSGGANQERGVLSVDNLSVSIPEPGVSVVGAAAGLMLLRRRTRGS